MFELMKLPEPDPLLVLLSAVLGFWFLLQQTPLYVTDEPPSEVISPPHIMVVRKLREEKNITQQDLAALCNFEKSNMARIESGRTNPTLLTLYKISSALKVSLSLLVDLDME